MSKIIKFNHPTLKKKATKVNPKDPELKKIIRQMKKLMTKDEGIGLAAPQMNVSQQIVTIQTQDGIFTLLNPKISKKSLKQEEMEEGCLSFPGFFGIVKRPYKVKVCFQDEQGKKIKLKAEGMLARVLQHEIDHLNGQLFIYKVKRFTKGDEQELWEKMRS